MRWIGIAIIIAKNGYRALFLFFAVVHEVVIVKVELIAGVYSICWILCQFHTHLDWCCHSITMEAFTPTRYKTAKIYRIEHIKGVNASLEVHKPRTFCPFVGSGDRARVYSRSQRTGTRRPGRSTRRWTGDRKRTAPDWRCGSTYRLAAEIACVPCSASSTKEIHEFQRTENSNWGIGFYLRYNF